MTKEFYNQYWQNRKDSKVKYRYRVFGSWIEPNSKILDIGCGDGIFAAYLKEYKKGVITGVDISEEACERTRKKNIECFCIDVEKGLPFETNSFDYVIASEILEHIGSSEAALKEMIRVSGKYLIVSVPNIAFWRYRLQLLFGRFPKQWLIHPVEHLRFWSYKDFKKWLKQFNLEISAFRGTAGKRWLRDIWPNLFAQQIAFKLLVKK